MRVYIARGKPLALGTREGGCVTAAELEVGGVEPLLPDTRSLGGGETALKGLWLQGGQVAELGQ